MVMLQYLPRPSFIPPIEYKFNDYLEFQFNWATFIWIFYIVSYHILEPVAAVCSLISPHTHSQAHISIAVPLRSSVLPITSDCNFGISST